MKAGIYILPIFAMFSAVSATAGVSLPVVNTAAAGVNARAAFGEKVVVAPAPVKPAKKDIKVAKVAPRAAAPIKITDVLSPNRPSYNLWANNSANIATDAPLRLPEPKEFAVLNKADFILPEEALDFDPTPIAEVREKTSELDKQIARLIELQNKADAAAKAVKPEPAPRVASVRPVKTAAAPTARVPSRINSFKAPAPKKVTVNTEEQPVALKRMVVDMEEDIFEPQVRTVAAKKTAQPTFDYNDEVPLSKLSPLQLKKAFQKTYVSDNKHLSTYRIDDAFDVSSDMTTERVGFDSGRDLSESYGGVRPLEIKISFRGEDSALSRDNYNLLSEYAGIVVSNAKRAIQVSIPEHATNSYTARKLAAKRLAIVEQVLHDSGVSNQRIIPVLSERDDDSFVLRVISNEQFQTMTQKKRDMFGDTVGTKSYKSMTW